MSQQGYIGRNPGDGRTIVNRQTSHVTTGVQTSFTMTVGYEVGYLDVYLNGIKQTETLDYTAADGSTINFSPSFAPMNGDVLEFVAFETLNISNIKSARRNFSVGQDLDVSGKVTIGSSLTVASDLVVNGTFTTINTEILDVEDKTVGIASTSSPSNTTADGAGIVIYGGSDGDKSLTWNSTKSNFVLVGGGVSIGTGVTISTPAANVLAFSVNSAEKARFNNFGAFTVGYEGEAWHESTYVGVLQAGSGAWIGQTPGASARAEWVNNAYYDSVNTRWEYIAADEANRIVLENGELKLQSADAGSADGAITWNEKLKMTVGGDFKIGAPTGIGITISSSGNVDSIGIVTASSFVGNVTGNATSADTVDITNTSTNSSFALTFVDTSGSAKTLRSDTSGIIFNPSSNTLTTGTFSGSGASLTNLNAGNLASGTVPTARLGSGTASSSTFLRGDSTFQTVNTDLVSDTSPQLGGDLDTNSHEILLDDNHAVKFGNDTDLTVLHSGSTGVINNVTGDLHIKTTGSGDDIVLISNDDIELQPQAGEAGIKVIGNGAVELYHNNNLRLSTASSGIDITGGVLFNQIDAIVGTPHNYLYGHNAGTASQRGLSIKGAEAALEILASDGGNHGGSLLIRGLNDGYGFVNDADNNRLQLFSFASSNDDFYLHGSGQNTSRRDLCFVANQDGAVELYHNGSKTFETKSGGNIALGTGAALEIKRSSAATGNLWMQFSDSGGSQKGYLGYGSGSSEIFYIVQQESANISVYIGNATRWNWNTSGHFYPQTNNQVDIGTSSNRVRNIYTMDLQLSNKGSQNDVDGTWGDYTIQEGESDLFLINKRSGKKFKFMLQEVS